MSTHSSPLPPCEEPSFPVSVLCLNREAAGSLQEIERYLARAARYKSALVAIPVVAGLSQADYCRLASRYRQMLAVGYNSEGSVKGAIIDADGMLLGETAQTHSLPGEVIALGGSLCPIDTPLGKIGLTLQSDLYFPEVHWALVQQGARLLVHLEGDRQPCDHFYSVLSPKVRALDLNCPFLIARLSSHLLKLVHNVEMGITGTPIAASTVFDQNGAILASTGYRAGIATAELSLVQEAISIESAANIPMERGNDIWRLFFNDSREEFFPPLAGPYAPPPRPPYAKRKIKIAIVTHRYSSQIGKSNDEVIFDLVARACEGRPDVLLLTEMESECRPDDPGIAAKLQRLVDTTKAAGSYLVIGGIRRANAPEEKSIGEERRTSHGWLWNRRGERVFESRIMLYGLGNGQGFYDTDFGRIAIRLCGDVYSPELSRLFALQGVEIVFNPSMSWGVSGLVNTELNQARAMDNGHYVVSAHLAFSDPGQRSHVIDPTGCVVAASSYYDEGVVFSEIDLDAPQGLFVKGDEQRTPGPNEGYLAGYRTLDTHHLVPMRELLRHHRRPELYAPLATDHPESYYIKRDRGDGHRLQPPVRPLKL